MTVHREQSMKREDQQDATIRCFLLTSVSTCEQSMKREDQQDATIRCFFINLCLNM